MTKLEQKLLELGYVYQNDFTYYKWIEFEGAFPPIEINAWLNIKQKKCKLVVLPNKAIGTQEQLDNLQQAFNEMQKDLEILKGCEDCGQRLDWNKYFIIEGNTYYKRSDTDE